MSRTEVIEVECSIPCFLNSLAYKSVILNKDLKISFINNDWKKYVLAAAENIENSSLGSNYIQVMKMITELDKHCFQDIEAGIESVITGKKEKFELEYPDTKFENRMWFKIIVTPFDQGVLIMHENITTRKQAQRDLETKEKQYKKIFNKAPIGMMLEDPEGNIIEVNESLCEMTAYSKEELEGSSIFDKLVIPERIEEAKKDIEIILSGQDLEFNLDNIDKNGNHYYSHFKETKINLPDRGEGILSMQVDLTDLRMKERKLKFLSYHDQLTNLYNRAFFDLELKRLDAVEQLPLTIIVIDVNGLKLINDIYGHLVGDQLIKQAAEVLKSSLRGEDVLARFGGDEFAVILPQTRKEAAEKIVDRINKKSENVKVKDTTLSLGIGFATKNNEDQEITEVFKIADDNMYQDKIMKSKNTKDKLIKNLIVTMESKSDESREHAQRLENLAVSLGSEIGLDYEQLNRLSLLASLHDIGKVTISESILKKPGSLTEEERELIKKHAERGYSIANSTDKFSAIAKYILHHHERWDGTGYPEGLKGEGIPLLSRIISIADAYDVMTHKQSYSKALTKEEALTEMRKNAGTQFDPELVKVFVRLMRE
ncbi:HD domain-containing phosphohydrolase [Halanaerobium saccharolyticum]|uniref:HD domain-containing phosphohydrolase n=1 Tax=Halanaerobium saccharolyticum TaxID=43595 RepID=UPI00106270DA|nr:HD domain-containing phosphohydrolase [Halanaerobium saccharolyticum]